VSSLKVLFPGKVYSKQQRRASSLVQLHYLIFTVCHTKDQDGQWHALSGTIIQRWTLYTPAYDWRISLKSTVH